MATTRSVACASRNRKCLEGGLKLLGDFWTLNIIDVLREEPLRFNEIQRHVEGINPATLANRLKKLEQAHLIERQEETLDKLSVTYALTQRGISILPVIGEIQIFADKNLQG
jgi:DNA-binding HxlR family transcriptional regulator